jgi:hypothetical protein
MSDHLHQSVFHTLLNLWSIQKSNHFKWCDSVSKEVDEN